MLSPSDINTKRFEKGAFGYKQEDVDAFLMNISEQFARLLQDNKELDNKLALANTRLEEYKNEEHNLSAALLGAQKMSDAMVREAKEQSDTMVREATVKAESIVSEAVAKRETLLAEATESAKQALTVLNGQIADEKNELARVQRETTAFKDKLLSMYRSQLELISKLPEVKKPVAPIVEEKPAPAPQPEVTEEEEIIEEAPVMAEEQAEEFPDIQQIAEEITDMPADIEDDDDGTIVFQKGTIPNVDFSKNPPKSHVYGQPQPKRRGFVPNLSDDEGEGESYAPAPSYEERAPQRSFLDVSDDVPLEADNSRFGDLKFGPGYDMSRDDDYRRGKGKKRR